MTLVCCVASSPTGTCAIGSSGRTCSATIGTVPVERLLSEIRLRKVMSAPAIAVGPDTELAEAASLMAQKKLGSLPVADRGRVVGMITETDLLRHIVGVNACCADVEAIVVSYP